MGIMMTKDTNDNTELDRRISADLRARAQQSRQAADIDGVEDSRYVEETKKTNKFTWVWIVLIVLAIISLICIVII